MASMGKVHLPTGIVGDEALEEYVRFPVGKHDDQVDADGAIARAISDAESAVIEPVVTTEDWGGSDYLKNEPSLSDAAWG